MSKKSMDFNYNYDRMNSDGLFSNRLMRRHKKIQSSRVPMNNVYWTYMTVINDRAMDVRNFRFVEYQGILNKSIQPFKKG